MNRSREINRDWPQVGLVLSGYGVCGPYIHDIHDIQGQ